MKPPFEPFANIELMTRVVVLPEVDDAPPVRMLSGGYQSHHSPSYDNRGAKPNYRHVVIFQYTLEGQGLLEIDGRRTHVNPGQAMVLNSCWPYRYRVESGGQWTFFYLTLTGERAEQTCDQVREKLGAVIDLPRDSPLLWTAARICRRIIAQHIITIWDSASEAFSMCMRLREHLSMAMSERSHARPELESVVQAIHDDLDYPWTIDQMAEIAGLSKYHFCRVFQQTYGKTPARYLMHERLEHAQNLLQATDEPIKRIAAECGFYDANHLCKAFRKRYGLTPGEVHRKFGL